MIRWMLLVAGICGGSGCTYVFDCPERSLRRAAAAFTAKDVTTFEQYVDLEGVARDVALGCTAMSKLDSYAEDQFAFKNEWTALGANFAENLLSMMGGALGDQLAATARGNFGNQSPDQLANVCGGMSLGDVSETTFETSGATSRAAIPVVLRGGTNSTLLVRLGDDPEGGWRIMGIEFTPTLDAYASEQGALAKTQALALRATVEASLDGEAYRRLHAYSLSHGEDAELYSFILLRGQAFMGAPTPVVALDTRIRQGRWFDDRIVGSFRNDGTQPVAKIFVKVAFFDRQDSLVGGSYEHFFQAQATDVLMPGDTATYNWDLNRFLWPLESIASASAFVVGVEWQDGSKWVHPAATAGLFD